MSTFAPLLTTLLNLAYAVRDAKIPLVIGGGFGLYLKEEHLRQSGERTLLKRLPESRTSLVCSKTYSHGPEPLRQ